MAKFFNFWTKGEGLFGRKTVHIADDPEGEIITGSDGKDIVFASDGAHLIDTSGGHDRVYAGDGDSTISTGSGNDRVYAGDGAFDIDGGSGHDRISVGFGNATIAGGSGNDRIFAAGGDNHIDGGAGNDRIRTGYGNDTIFGGSGDDRIRSFGGDNVIDGGTGHDRIRTGDGDDLIAGGDGHDWIRSGWGNDTIDGGSGDDFIGAGKGDDVVDGGSGHDVIRTGRGADMVAGGSGDDWLRTGRDNDTASGGAGSDWIELQHGDDLGVYVLADNIGSWDYYSGGRGQDTLRLEFTQSEWQSADIQADIEGFLDFLEGAGGRGWWRTDYSFQSFDLVVSSFEALEILVDGSAVTPGDNAVTAVDDAAGLSEGGQITGNVLDNDQVPDQLDQVVLVSGVSRGALTLDVQGAYSFAANDDFDHLAEGETTTESFIYQVRDLDGDVATASVTLTITGTNDAPTLAAGAAQAAEDGAVVEVDLTALGNDTDSDDSGTSLSYSLAAPLAEGGVTLVGGTLRFEPGADFQDLATGQSRDVVVQITATDAHGAQAFNTVTITVVGTNDAPVMVPVTTTAAENGAAIVVDLAQSTSDVDDGEDGSTLNYAIVTAPGEGIATLTGHTLSFDPGTDFQDLAIGESRDVVIAVSGTDAQGATVQSHVTVTVVGANDTPELSAYVGSAAEDGAGQTIDLSTLASDADTTDEAALTYSIASAPSEGQVTLSGSQLSFDPSDGFQDLGAGESRTVTIDVTVRDAQGAEATNTISFVVDGVNDGPVAGNDTISGDEDTLITGNVVINDSDIEGDSLTVTAATLSTEQGGTVVLQADGSFDYTPPANFSGSDGFDYEVSDGNATSQGHVTLTVHEVNDAPVVAPANAAAHEDGAILSGTLAGLATDVDSTNLSFALVTPVAGLSLSADGSYQLDASDPAYQDLSAGELRVIEATFAVSDQEGGVTQAQFTLTITGTNDAPVSQDMVVTTSGPVTFTPEYTDIDAGDSHTVALATASTQGGATLNANGSITYVTGAEFAALALGEEAQDSFGFVVDDGQGGSDTGSVTVTLVGLNDAPTLAGQNLAADEDGDVVTLDLAGLGDDIDSDDDGNSLTYTISEHPGEGSASLSGTTLSFDPGADFQDLAAGETRSVVVQITATDRHGVSAVADVTVTVAGKDEPSTGVNTQALVVGLTVPNTTMVITDFTDTDGDGVPDMPFTPAQSVGLPDVNGFSDYRSAYGDLDGDGDIDLVIAQGDRVSTYFNNGDGDGDGVPEFQQVVLSNAQINYGVHDVAVGDFDGNGIDDVVLSGYNGPTLVFMGQGDTDGSGAVEMAEYGTPVSVANAAGQNYGTTVADLNGDGHQDIVQANYTAGPIEILYGDGSGGFTQRLFNDPGGENTLDVAVGDLNGDGRADMVAARSNGQDDILYLNQGDTDGDGQDDFARSVFHSGGDNMEVEFADLDGDGDLDVIMAEYSNAGTAIFMNDGNGGLSKLALPSGGDPYGAATGIAVGDIDGDGDYDIVASHWYNGTGHTVLLNSGGSDMGFALTRATLDSTSQSWDVEFINITDDLIFV